MLKACWDCLAGEQQRQSDDRYGVHLNGVSSAPPWPTFNAQHGKMFAVPTPLKEDDEIIIRGMMTDGMVDIALRPDGNNVVTQINVIYPDNQTHDQITLFNGPNNPVGEYRATDYFTDTTFDVRFIMMQNAVRISIQDSYLQSVPINNTDDIRYISVRGQVKQLNFSFNAY